MGLDVISLLFVIYSGLKISCVQVLSKGNPTPCSLEMSPLETFALFFHPAHLLLGGERLGAGLREKFIAEGFKKVPVTDKRLLFSLEWFGLRAPHLFYWPCAEVSLFNRFLVG